MTILRFAPFGGLIPKADPAVLPPGAAQTAQNCRFGSGMLEAYNDTAAVHSHTTSAINTIYRYGQTVASDTNYWFVSPYNVNYVKGPVVSDTVERTYYTGDGYPKVTDVYRALSSAPYPGNFLKLGVPAPAAAPVLAVTGACSASATIEERSYVWTFINDFGEESAPSPASELVEVHLAKTDPVPATDSVPASTVSYDMQTVSVIMDGPPSGAYALAGRRLYRTATGSGSTDFLFVVELPLGTTRYDDSISSDALGETLPTQGWEMLPSDATGMALMENGIMTAHTNYDVYLSVPYAPYAYRAEDVKTVGYPIVGTGAFDQSLAVLTKGFPSVITGTDSQSASMSTLKELYPCSSAASIVSALNSVFYASPDGLIQINGAGAQNLTEGFFTRREWSALDPTSMICAAWDNKAFIFYDNGVTQGGYILDPQAGIATIDLHVTAAFTDPITNSLFLAVGSEIVKWDAGSAGEYVWKSRKESLPMPKNLGLGQVLATTYPLTMKVSATLESHALALAVQASRPTLALTVVGPTLTFEVPVTSERPFRLPDGFRARQWEIELSGGGRVQSAVLADSSEELQRV